MGKSRQAIVAVSAYITNDKGEVLLVKSHARSGTWELPGGQVEAGEALDEAIQREVLEETGVAIRLIGLKSRVLDAMKGATVVPYETWAMEPSRRVARLER
ncbi:NUDIX domain-containing protein [Thermaerobacter sp. FW80]|uniref:NUDIX domain-containing protein n=1 Tax=Thermaerobacter sp. FW80 TaxID=2546351 RepID=UPI001FAA2BA1|nr:NUDIX hydrolase [Thermaerobacter sp. FW80]